MTILVILVFFYVATLFVFKTIELIKDAFVKSEFEKQQVRKWNKKILQTQKNLSDD
jgi:hypothetical protein